MASPGTLLDLAADLERRDREVAAALEHVVELDRRARDVRARSAELHEQLAASPAALAALDRAHAEARAAREQAAHARATAEERLHAVRGGTEERRALAEHELGRAREAERDAAARVDRLEAERREQEAAGAAARAEEATLVERAERISRELAGVGRISASGLERPGDGVEGLPEWASRVHAALFVVRGQLEAERERLVREANELGGTVLGEQVAGASVTLVRRRLEEALRR